jgi:hypothetical protein
LAPVIFVERCGAKNLGTLLGVYSTIVGIVSAPTPVVTGLLYDKFGDCRLAVVSASATFIGFALILLIGARKAAR